MRSLPAVGASSTARMISLPASVGMAGINSHALRAYLCGADKARSKSPSPSLLSILGCQRDCLTQPQTMLRPTPVCLRSSLVVKNGGNALSRMAAEIPVPVSVTESSPGRSRIARPVCSVQPNIADRPGRLAATRHRLSSVERRIDQCRSQLAGASIRSRGARQARTAIVSRVEDQCSDVGIAWPQRPAANLSTGE